MIWNNKKMPYLDPFWTQKGPIFIIVFIVPYRFEAHLSGRIFVSSVFFSPLDSVYSTSSVGSGCLYPVCSKDNFMFQLTAKFALGRTDAFF